MNFINGHGTIIPYRLRDDGIFPNSELPVIFYKDALVLNPDSDDKPIIGLFSDHNWKNAWTNGIYDYHHYHSTTHEVLGICSGRASVMLGGEKGVILELKKGDVLLIPAGVAHKRLDASKNFSCVGAYPDGKDYDVRTGGKAERETTDDNIRKVPLPEIDPVYGKEGPMLKYWKSKDLSAFTNTIS